MGDFFKPRYKQVLLRLQQELRTNRVLSPFWQKRSDWPDGGKRMIFVCEALDQVGRTKFGDAWTGKESRAYRRIDGYPDFESTLVEFHHELREWQTRQNADFRPGMQVPASWQAKYSPTYDDAVAYWERTVDENAAALARLDWAISWVISRARDGELKTHLRPADTVSAPGTYRPAPEGFWNVEDAVWYRLRDGSLDYASAGSSNAGSESLEQVYIFFDRNSFDHTLLTIAEPADISPELTGVYLSPYMRLALAVSKEEELTETYQSKKENVVATVHRLAPLFGIEVDGQKTMLEYLATMVRHPESKKGRQRKLGQTQEAG